MAEILLTQFGMGMTDGTIIAWHKKEGDEIKQGDVLCEVETAKTNAEIESPVSGVLTKIHVAVDENVPVNTVLAIVTEAGLAAEPSAEATPEAPVKKPAAKKAAASKAKAKAVEPVAAAEPESVPHSMTRLTIARRLTESKQQVPHFYVKGACRIDALLSLRKQINTSADVKTSVNDLIVRAVALALREVPEANVSWGEKAMQKHQQVDVAVAVATPRGLVTPIVRNVEQKQPQEIASEIQALAERARGGKLKPDEYQGGTVTVSNLGMFGVEEFSAIINPPQSMIFAIGAGEERVIANDGKVEVGTLMNVTISVDHRAVDGAVAAQVFAAFKRLIEQPEALSAA
ncbi:dihydrolipoamide acetyltransferase family protein [Pseudomonas sp. OTU5201]|uniref:dihydrolipoamide acetyltransferase family protein n=1 Tax=Pseudomonas sp. OTU5201 TaxID=3043850 RepID=UPI00313E1960